MKNPDLNRNDRPAVFRRRGNDDVFWALGQLLTLAGEKQRAGLLPVERKKAIRIPGPWDRVKN